MLKVLFSPRGRVILGVSVILLLVVLAFFLPSESDSGNVTGDLATVPTVSITNLIGNQTVNRYIELDGVRMTVMQVMQATKFSDDRKRAGTYTIRVLVQTRNNAQNPIGIDYASRVRLGLPGGAVLKPKYISVKPVEMPGRSQTGFFDFPASDPVQLTTLSLVVDGKPVLSFGKM